MRTLTPALVVLAACASAPSPSSLQPPSMSVSSSAPVRPGIEVFLSDVPAALRGKRVGLITNHSAIDRSGTLDIDLIDRLTGSDKVRLAIEGGRLPALLDEWDREAAGFFESRRRFLLYR